MRFKSSRIGACVVVLLVTLGYTGESYGQLCHAARDDDLWQAVANGDLPDEGSYTWDDCTSEIDGVMFNHGTDGWVMHVVDDDGQQPGDEEDRSAYCKTSVFDHDCQSAVFELSVRTFSGDSDPPHDITDIVFLTGLRDTAKDITIVITMDGVGFATGSPLDWLQIDYGNGGKMDAFIDMANTNDKQHIYRVVKDSAAETITLTVDKDEEDDELSFDYDELGNSSLNQSHLATSLRQGESEYYMRYYRHRVGATEFQTSGVGCDADFNDDDFVNTSDLLALLANWGDCPELPTVCPWDLDDDDLVSTIDLLILLASWGPCT